jgi:hypothetical protein
LVTDPGAYAGWDILVTANRGGHRADATADALTIRLHRPAVLAVVWRDGSSIPTWLQGWTEDSTRTVVTAGQTGNGPRRTFRKSFAAGEAVLSGPAQGTDGQRNTPWILVAEPDGRPSPAPAVPSGREAPRANETCPAWVLDQYITDGPDGQEYRTWHPHIDPVYWCYFRDEHGSNPDLLRSGYRPPFDFATARAGQSEAHQGFKNCALDDGSGRRWLFTQHFGTGGLARACTCFHTVDVAVASNASGELLAELHFLGDYGASVENATDKLLTPSGCPEQVAAPRAEGSNGVRRLPVQGSTLAFYEPWRLGVTGNVLGLEGGFTINTMDAITICNGLACGQAVQTAGNTGSLRHVSWVSMGIRAAANDGELYTDPYARQVVGASTSGVVRQYVKPGLLVQLPPRAATSSVKCHDTQGWGRLYQYGPDPLVSHPTNREASLRSPN